MAAGDFSDYDAFIEAGGTSYGVIYYDQSKPQTESRDLTPRRQDVGNNPWEVRPDSGDVWSQMDFSHGAGQQNFHHASRDEKRFLASIGFDISEPGKLKHLHVLTQGFADTGVGRGLAVADGVPFSCAGTNVLRDDDFPSATWGTENPHNGEGVQTVQDLTAEGSRLFAALGSNGIHLRSSAGAWSHYVTAGATGIDRIAWLKDRLIAADGRQLYEIVTSGALPTPIFTLKEGWRFEDIFESGEYIYACAVNVDSQQSRVYHFGLNQSASALEAKGSTAVPGGTLIYKGLGYLNLTYLAGGIRTSSGGYDPVIFQALPDARGALFLLKLVQGEGSGSTDLSVRAGVPDGDRVIFGWSVISDEVTKTVHEGTIVHHLGRDALSFHLATSLPTNPPRKALALLPHKGLLMANISSLGLQYESPTDYVQEATLWTSVADWANAGQKIWDLFEVHHKPLASGESIEAHYSVIHPEEGSYTLALTSNTVGAAGKSARLASANIKSRTLALRLHSKRTTATAAPELLGYSVRSNPAPAVPEFHLSRFIRILPEDRKDEQAQTVYPPGRSTEAFRETLMNLAHSWVTFYEPGDTWQARVVKIADVEPEVPFQDVSGGDATKRAFVVQIVMEATRV